MKFCPTASFQQSQYVIDIIKLYSVVGHFIEVYKLTFLKILSIWHNLIKKRVEPNNNVWLFSVLRSKTKIEVVNDVVFRL